jgi:DNA mismatch endonuclease (patch repair protein)
VHGCFWHMHRGCTDSTLPGGTARKRSFWRAKLEANRQRDRRAVRSLLTSGVRVAVVWECITRHPEQHPRALARLVRWIRGRQQYLELP